MSDTLSSPVGTAIAQNTANIDQNRTDTWRTLYCYVMKINDDKGIATIMLPPESDYVFSNSIPSLSFAFTEVKLVGLESNSRAYITPVWYWKYMVKIQVRTDSTTNKIQATTGYLTTAPILAGVNWDMYNTENPDDRESKIATSEIVRDVVDSYNKIVDELQTVHKDYGFCKSTPETNTTEWKAYTFKYKTTAVASLRKELERFNTQYEATTDIKGKIKASRDKFKQVEPGLTVTDKGTTVTDRNGKEISVYTRASLTSFYTSADFRKASWKNIRARGRKFNTLMEKTPSTLIQPLTTFVKAIGDVEDLGISSLMAVYSIISLGQGFKDSGSKPATGNTNTNTK